MEEKDKIAKLVETLEYEELSSMGRAFTDEKSKFDILSTFDDLIDENCLSRILAYLFDSKREHSLKQTFFRAWLSAKSDKKTLEFLTRIPSESDCETIAMTEWLTEKKRRLDILIKILSPNGKLHAVIGIENKVNSGEQVEQISDYQKSLAKAFPGLPKIIIFLTPNGRISKTSIELEDCHALAYSYDSIIIACDAISKNIKGQAEIFTKILKNHILKLVNVNTMEDKIRKIINKLYEDSNHRHAIKLIGQYSPNIYNVFEGLERYLRESKVFHNAIYSDEINFSIHGASEFKVYVESLQKSCRNKGIYPHYMLHYKKSGNSVPDINDEFVLRIMLHYEDLDGKDRKTKDLIRNKVHDIISFSSNLGQTQHWWNWVNIWVGGSYRLVDLGKKDIKGLADLLINGINETYLPLKLNLENLAKKKKF